jgi:hypothetical protein
VRSEHDDDSWAALQYLLETLAARSDDMERAAKLLQLLKLLWPEFCVREESMVFIKTRQKFYRAVFENRPFPVFQSR